MHPSHRRSSEPGMLSTRQENWTNRTSAKGRLLHRQLHHKSQNQSPRSSSDHVSAVLWSLLAHHPPNLHAPRHSVLLRVLRSCLLCFAKSRTTLRQLALLGHQARNTRHATHHLPAHLAHQATALLSQHQQHHQCHQSHTPLHRKSRSSLPSPQQSPPKISTAHHGLAHVVDEKTNTTAATTRTTTAAATLYRQVATCPTQQKKKSNAW
jgi:hypothetical protein